MAKKENGSPNVILGDQQPKQSMKSYLAHKFRSDNRNKELVEALAESLKNSGVETVIMARDFEKWGEVKFTPQELMKLSFGQIDLCDCLILEFSEKGTGLGIEAGYAYATKKPIYVIAKSGLEISTTLQGIADKIVFYNNPSEIGNKLF